MEGTVTSFQTDKQKYLWINGVGMTSLCTETKLMAYLPLLFVQNPFFFLFYKLKYFFVFNAYRCADNQSAITLNN